MTTEHPVESMVHAELRRDPPRQAHLAEIWHAGLVHEDCVYIDWDRLAMQVEVVLGKQALRAIRARAAELAENLSKRGSAA